MRRIYCLFLLYLCEQLAIFFSLCRQKNCEDQPWLIDPGPEQYLYVKVPGIVMSSNTSRCETKNRIVVYQGGQARYAVCPKPSKDFRHHSVEVFSEGWHVKSSAASMLAPSLDPARTIAVEFIVTEPDRYTVTWLELTRRYRFLIK